MGDRDAEAVENLSELRRNAAQSLVILADPPRLPAPWNKSLPTGMAKRSPASAAASLMPSFSAIGE
jgi:hypothetical protein